MRAYNGKSDCIREVRKGILEEVIIELRGDRWVTGREKSILDGKNSICKGPVVASNKANIGA